MLSFVIKVNVNNNNNIFNCKLCPQRKTLSTSALSSKIKFLVCSSHFSNFYCSKMFVTD